ncbi:MAG: hypothetical protein KC636_15615 [Myxococcales bacterium]|nr:hypothetical protein [Myxococcales bacterium]
MRSVWIGTALGLLLAACGGDSTYLCNIEFLAEPDGEVVATEERDVGEQLSAQDAFKVCEDYAIDQLNDERKAYTCSCSSQ